MGTWPSNLRRQRFDFDTPCVFTNNARISFPPAFIDVVAGDLASADQLKNLEDVSSFILALWSLT